MTVQCLPSRRGVLAARVGLLLVMAGAAAGDGDAPSHGHPFFMPAAERARITRLVRTEAWAADDYARWKAAAEKGDGYSAAFLYAIEGDPAYLPAARQKLLAQYGAKTWAVATARARLADPAFFTAGQPGIPDVYYDLDISGLVAYDWAWNGLNADDRRTIEDGMLAVARYRMRCMDRWTQTPNLVLKPTFMVAMTGLVTQDKECLEWGFHRKPGSSVGGYFEVLDAMLRDGGPWHEAPIYPGAHTGLLVMSLMSRYRQLYDGSDWFRRRTPHGGSPQGLMDYYIDSAYPIEQTGLGAGQIRCANYGDGSTAAAGDDLFLVNPAERKGNIILEEPLAAAFQSSGADPRYASFAAMIPGYRPALWDRPPLPAQIAFPPAPSKVWPTYGLAMLRSDESPAYWTNTSAIAVFALMTQGYGHDHRDKFSIMLHGANRLFYPDYNPIQYENPDIGWTRNSVCHNTLIVDEADTRDAQPTAVRHDFTPEVKFLAVSASAVFDGVDQTRALLLTREYLLDVFQARSDVPHTYDYLLHTFAQPRPANPDRFQPSEALAKRYWLLRRQQAMTTDGPWAMDFVNRDESATQTGTYSAVWYDHAATLRLCMAPEPATLVAHGVDTHNVPMLVARRADRRATVFVSTHEPFAGATAPGITNVCVLAQTHDAVFVRVDATGYSDYAAIAFGPQAGATEHTLASSQDTDAAVCFRDYGYLRVTRDGAVTARGNWLALRIPRAEGEGALPLNGRKMARDGAATAFGRQPIVGAPAPAPDSECPLAVGVTPAVVRLAAAGRRTALITITNRQPDTVSGWIEFRLPADLTAVPSRPPFGPLAPGAVAQVPVAFEAAALPEAARVTNEFSAHAPGVLVSKGGGGRRIVPFRIVRRTAEHEEPFLFQPLTVMIGPVLEPSYRHPLPNVYRVEAPRYTAQLAMFHGLCTYLADDDGVARVDGSPLFTISDGKTNLLSDATDHAFTWTTETPAHLVAHAYDRCRYDVAFGEDRIIVSMDPGWTQFDPARFTVPGRWLAPGGASQWGRVIVVDNAGRETDAPPGPGVRIAAAELAFPGSGWSVAFAFDPPQPVAFNGTELSFPIGSLTGDRWSIGFCRPGELDAWRKGGGP